MIISEKVFCPNCNKHIDGKPYSIYSCYCLKFGDRHHSCYHPALNLIVDKNNVLEYGNFIIGEYYQINLNNDKPSSFPPFYVMKYDFDYQGVVLSKKYLFGLKESIHFDFSKSLDVPKLLQWIKVHSIFS